MLSTEDFVADLAIRIRKQFPKAVRVKLSVNSSEHDLEVNQINFKSTRNYTMKTLDGEWAR